MKRQGSITTANENLEIADAIVSILDAARAWRQAWCGSGLERELKRDGFDCYGASCCAGLERTPRAQRSPSDDRFRYRRNPAARLWGRMDEKSGVRC